MRRYDRLINFVRLASENEDVSDTQGITTTEFVQYGNDAQERLQSVILSNMPNIPLFDTTYSQSLVANQDAYDVSTGDAMYGASVRLVEYRRSSSDSWTRLLPQHALELAGYDVSGDDPQYYRLRGDQVIVAPYPSSSTGTLRTTFPKRLDRLDIPRGTIETVNTSGSNYTSLVLASDTLLDDDIFDTDLFLCVNDAYGEITYQNLEYTSYDSGSRTITLAASQATSLGTIAVGNLVTVGKYTTSVSKLPRETEKYLIAYMTWKIQKRDSNSDSVDQNSEIIGIENEIIAQLRDYSRDVTPFPIINEFWT